MWVKTEGNYKIDMPDVEWDLLSDSEKYDACEWREYRFDTSELTSYNESRRDDTTTIRMKNGDSQTINMRIVELDKIIFGS